LRWKSRYDAGSRRRRREHTGVRHHGLELRPVLPERFRLRVGSGEIRCPVWELLRGALVPVQPGRHQPGCGGPIHRGCLRHAVGERPGIVQLPSRFRAMLRGEPVFGGCSVLRAAAAA
jgi:hypothetical protein